MPSSDGEGGMKMFSIAIFDLADLDPSHAAWALVATVPAAYVARRAYTAASGTLVRLALTVLAAHAARKALRPSRTSKAADRLRAHRLAVLRALLNALATPRR
jgi:hypothetical protein